MGVALSPPVAGLLSPEPAAAEGIEPQVEIVTENFLAVPHLVAGTDRIGLMPERVATPAPSAQPIAVVQPAFEIGHLVESLPWHPLHEREPAHM